MYRDEYIKKKKKKKPNCWVGFLISCTVELARGELGFAAGHGRCLCPSSPPSCRPSSCWDSSRSAPGRRRNRVQPFPHWHGAHPRLLPHPHPRGRGLLRGRGRTLAGGTKDAVIAARYLHRISSRPSPAWSPSSTASWQAPASPCSAGDWLGGDQTRLAMGSRRRPRPRFSWPSSSPSSAGATAPIDRACRRDHTPRGIMTRLCPRCPVFPSVAGTPADPKVTPEATAEGAGAEGRCRSLSPAS